METFTGISVGAGSCPCWSSCAGLMVSDCYWKLSLVNEAPYGCDGTLAHESYVLAIITLFSVVKACNYVAESIAKDF